MTQTENTRPANSDAVDYAAYRDKGYSYESYRDLIRGLIAEGKTTGNEPTEELYAIMRLNNRRMTRVEEEFLMQDELRDCIKSLPRTITCFALVESWCVDSAHLVSGMHCMTQASDGRVTLRIFLRDEYPILMNNFLTRGARIIPKLICLDDTDRVVAIWGPRSATAERLVQEFKLIPGSAGKTNEPLLQWYAENRSRELQEEMLELFRSLT